MTQIHWTKCSERMPPDDDKFQCIAESTVHKSLQIIGAEKLHLLLKFGMLLPSTRWTPYTPEAWKELNR